MSAKEEMKEAAASVSTVPNGGSSEEKSDTIEVKTDLVKKEPSVSDNVDEETEEFEMAPDDLDDFVVLDEAEISDNEAEDGRKWIDEDDGKQWDCPVHRLAPRTYTRSQLEPSELDPRCKPDWPLAGYYPVYVGNFYLPKKTSDYNFIFAVHKYFASKGLPAFMVFRLKDSFFENYQKRIGMYDMLVYFINKKDATRAINTCHRDLYYGHRLKVYCGRTSSHAASRDKSKFFKVKHLKAEDKLETETNLEKAMRRYGQVLFLSKHNLDYFTVLLAQKPDRAESIKQNARYEATINKGTVRKQRFIEEDVLENLTKEISDNPKFMRTRVRHLYLKYIAHGVIPEMYKQWNARDLKEVKPQSHSQPNTRQHYEKEQFAYKRRYDDDGYGGNGASLPKSRRQLLREARSLEVQLRAVQSKIHQRKIFQVSHFP
ncbi:uncharacterized protein LOC134227760 isoform X2 [Armigeres subalbatus]|uniref:uncharacterized protein LOC134227760 isoform X2 n=1 Tax=Armigeres subalbatus TaxID=124917 RepID=UPI002ED2AECB